MAVYEPPQPLWKRSLAGVLDFILAATVFGLPLYRYFPADRYVAAVNLVGRRMVFGLGPGASLALLALIIGYFVVLGRTGAPSFNGSSG